MQIFQQRIAQQVVVQRSAERSPARSRPASRAARQRRSPITSSAVRFIERPDDDRLQQANLGDGLDQFGHRVLVEHRSWLPRIGVIDSTGELGEGRLRRAEFRLGGRLSRGRNVRPQEQLTQGLDPVRAVRWWSS